ncbi:phosphinothricin n-acetyltransferase [Leptolyngbya sp. Heron Island J]|uniref:GNAT family N-acetyltransferase n=1 Tax=Leptolyngbya sp. Heron Island J TaxID=1385935 RepID=UPI0003B9C0CF|nr:GNAT family N-acetyltransferase [Leptolyngbya sp. Heron Island J]ESA34970.1 phosphinothricin n-acetyltransferase [Leptolyngbya sp. Heron Island J]
MDIIVRLPQASDLAPLTDLYNYYILNTTITFDITPYTLAERRERWWCHYSAKGRHRLLVAEQDKTVVGYATSSQFRAKAAYDTSVETSIYLNPDAQGQGIGTQLYQALFRSLANEDVHRAYAGITMPNSVSVALHQKYGFYSVGRQKEVGRKFGRYWDVEWFEKSL